MPLVTFTRFNKQQQARVLINDIIQGEIEYQLPEPRVWRCNYNGHPINIPAGLNVRQARTFVQRAILAMCLG